MSAIQSQKSNEEESSQELITIGEFCQAVDKDDQIRDQLMENKYVSKCRYEDGYVYQPVYSCKTCYLE
jgi:hypothetical protein